jgi:hypothetical protein
MAVEDVYTQNRRLWVRLREKGGKRHAMPCDHNLEEYLIAYLDGAELRSDPKGPLFRTIGRGTGAEIRQRRSAASLERQRKGRIAPRETVRQFLHPSSVESANLGPCSQSASHPYSSSRPWLVSFPGGAPGRLLEPYPARHRPLGR